MAYRLDSTASDVATHRAAWSPAQAAEYAAHKDFLLLKLLSKHRGAAQLELDGEGGSFLLG